MTQQTYSILNFTSLAILAREKVCKASYRIQGRNPVSGVGDGLKRGHLFHCHTDWGPLDKIPTTHLWCHTRMNRDSFNSGIPQEVIPSHLAALWPLKFCKGVRLLLTKHMYICLSPGGNKETLGYNAVNLSLIHI